MPLQTYEQALAQSQGAPLSLLLGNGFSRAWRDDIFNYANLLAQAEFGPRDQSLRQLFDRLETYDFEAVARSLQAAHLVVSIYSPDSPILNEINEDLERLKSALIVAISNTHPSHPGDVSDAEYTAVRQFLSRFVQIFTVNYDLLFYWARNMDLPPPGWDSDDGFRTHRRWQEQDTEQNAHFLHGSLHIYQARNGVMKVAFSHNQRRIIEQVREGLDRGRFPLFVSEPTAAKKLDRIEHNPYLNACYRTLGTLEGSLIVLGHSLDENDSHIFKQIRRSKVRRIFVSLHGDENTEGNLRTKANALAFLGADGRTVDFFDSATAPVWTP